MISVAGRIVASTVDVGVVGIEEWSSGYFSDFIFWLNGGFKLDRINS